MSLDLCICPAPLRDTSNPTRRFHCVRCAGVTPSSGRLSLQAATEMVAAAHAILDRLLTDLTAAHEACYGPQAHPAGDSSVPKGSHSDPTLAIIESRSQSMALFALATEYVGEANHWLRSADEAAGECLYRSDPHRGPADHVKAAYHDTIPAGRPDLAAAHAAQARRRARGEI